MLGESEQNGPLAVTPFNFRMVGEGSPSIDLQGLFTFLNSSCFDFLHVFLLAGSLTSQTGLGAVACMDFQSCLGTVLRLLALQRALARANLFSPALLHAARPTLHPHICRHNTSSTDKGKRTSKRSSPPRHLSEPRVEFLLVFFCSWMRHE